MTMQRHYKTLCGIIASIGITSCVSTTHEKPEAEIYVSSESIEDIYSAPISHIDTLQLNYPDSVTIGAISQVYAADDMFVIVDNMSQPYGFSQNGEYKCQYGLQGEGPSEFVNMGACAVYKDEIVICDSYKQRMLFYDRDTGDFKRHIDFPYGSFDMIQQCVFVSDTTAILARYVFNQNNSVYAVANIDNKTVSDFASVPMKTDNVAMPVGWHTISAYQGSAIYIEPFSPCIYRYPQERWIYIDQPKPLYDREELARIGNFSIMTYAKAMNEGRFAGFTDVFELKDWIFLALQDVEFYLINKNSWAMNQFKYDKDDMLNYKYIAKIIGSIPQKNALIGADNHIIEEDNIYIYHLKSNQ